MTIHELINTREVFFDGASGTLLQSAGLPSGAPPDGWNLERAEAIRAMHRQYLEAGSDVLSTVTFRAGTFPDGGTEEIIAAAVKNCREAIAEYRADTDDKRPVFVALDVGPSGNMLGMPGGPGFAEAYEYFRPQVVAGEKAGVDMILFETFTDVYELKAAVLAATEHTALPVLCTVTFEENGRTLMGTDAETAALLFDGLGLTAFGANCSLGPAEMLPMIRNIARYATAPVMAQPNAGLPRIEDGRAVYDITPAEFAAAVADIAGAGARIVGGCCGTSPEYIRALTAALSPESSTPAQRDAPAPPYPSVCATAAHLSIAPGSGFTMGVLKPEGTDDTRSLSSAVKKLAKETDLVALDLTGLTPGDAARLSATISMNARVPLAFRSTDAAALEAAVRVCRGKPAVILPALDTEFFISGIETAKKYGTAVIIERGDADEAAAIVRARGLGTDRVITIEDGRLSPL